MRSTTSLQCNCCFCNQNYKVFGRSTIFLQKDDKCEFWTRDPWLKQTIQRQVSVFGSTRLTCMQFHARSKIHTLVCLERSDTFLAERLCVIFSKWLSKLVQVPQKIEQTIVNSGPSDYLCNKWRNSSASKTATDQRFTFWCTWASPLVHPIHWQIIIVIKYVLITHSFTEVPVASTWHFCIHDGRNIMEAEPVRLLVS